MAATKLALEMTERAVSGATTVAPQEFVVADASSAAYTVTGPTPAAGVKRWAVKRHESSPSGASGKIITVSYLDSTGTTRTISMFGNGDVVAFRASGSGFRVENGYKSTVQGADGALVTREVGNPNRTASKWREVFNTGTFNGHADPVMFWGWNADRATGGGDAAEPSWFQGFEADYWNTGSNHAFEWYMRYGSADGLTTLQPIYVGVDRNGNGATNGYIGFDIGGAGAGNFIVYDGGTATSLFSLTETQFTFTRQGSFTAQGANTAMTIQINASGTAQASLQWSGRWNFYDAGSSSGIFYMQSVADSKYLIALAPGTGGAIYVNATRIGFYGATPIAKQTLAAAATDAASTQALANDIRAKLIALGLTS